MKKIALAVMLACNSGLLAAEETAIVNVAEQVQADTAEAPITQLEPMQIRAESIGSSLLLDTPSTAGSRLDLTPRETPASITIVDRNLIEQRGATNTQEILKSVPGLPLFTCGLGRSA